jgi:hypothetical protein
MVFKPFAATIFLKSSYRTLAKGRNIINISPTPTGIEIVPMVKEPIALET